MIAIDVHIIHILISQANSRASSQQPAARKSALQEVVKIVIKKAFAFYFCLFLH